MKKLGLLLAAVMLSALFTGCKQGSPQPSAPPSSSPPPVQLDTVEINVVTSYGSDDGNRQSYERAISLYEAETGNIVRDNSRVSNEEWKAQVTASFNDGNEPDVLFYFTGADSNKIISDGKVVSIDEIRSVYPDYASNMKDGMLAKSPVDGKKYAVPVNGYWEGLYVNKKVLEDCGVEIPGPDTTWSQFLSDCQKIADKGYVPIAASLGEVPHYWFEFCIFNNGNLDSHPVLPASSSDNIGKNWVAGLNDIKELYEKGFFPDNTATASGAETDSLMISDRAAFMIEGSWKLGWFAENAADINNFTVTYVPAKNDRKPTDIVGGLSMGYFITKKAWDNPEKREACVKFVMSMTTDEVVTTFGATAVTALINGTTIPSDSSSLIKDAYNMTRNTTGITVATADSLIPDARGDLFANITGIVTGSITPEKAIDSALDIMNTN